MKQDGIPVGDKTSGLHQVVCRAVILLYFVIMTVVYPYYAPGGYVQIGEVKYGFFRYVSLVVFVLMAGMLLLSVPLRRDWEWAVRNYRKMSVTDWFAYGYLIAVLLSYLCSPYKKDALWGAQGWYMGVMSQIIFVMVYFCFSRYFCYSLGLVFLWLAAASGVFMLGICNSYSLYPIVMEGQTEGFISTLGNINWFCGYWSVTAPMGILLYWCGGKRRIRLAAGIYSMVAMLAGLVQGSSSAYLVFMALFVLLFFLSLQSNERWYRFLELCMMFAVSCLIARFLTYLPGLTYHYRYYGVDGQEGAAAFVWESDAACWFLLILAILYILFRVLERYGIFPIGKHKWLWVCLGVGAVIIICVLAFLLLLDNGIFYFREVPSTVEQDGCLELAVNENWGNGRGATWSCGAEAYRNMDLLHKMVGIGPDCFAVYVYDLPQLAQKLAGRFGNLRLTNAHNEQITLAVNTGILGLLCYTGVFVTAFVRYLKRAGQHPVFYLCAAGVLGYTVHNLVSFQQALSTPYVFMALGIGENRIYADKMKRKNE